MSPTPTHNPRHRGIVFQLAAVALVVVSALTATGLARWLRAPGEKPPAKFSSAIFKDWDKPDFVLVLTGEQHGYIKPCGCSRPQVGGLERRYNFLQQLKANGWPYVAFDLGDVPQKSGPADLPNLQGMLKYIFSMRALKKMDYATVGFGEYEVGLGLNETLANYALNDEPKVVSSNLMDAEKNFPDMVIPWKAVDVKQVGVRVGVAAVTDPTVADRIKKLTNGDTKIRFGETNATLDNAVKQMAASSVGFPVLLYQGPLSRNSLQEPLQGAVACAEAYPQFPVVLCLSAEDDPSAQPIKVKTKKGSDSLVITVGRKGKYVGVVGVWKTGNKDTPFRIRYERVEMSEDFLTPDEEKKSQPIVELLEEYSLELKNKEFLKQVPQKRHELQIMPEIEAKDVKTKVPVTYVGTEECAKCHQAAYNVWKESGHAHAYKTLEDAKYPSNQQYNPECIVCHTVGFGVQSGFVNEEKTPDLKDVGCENCHGPGSMHAENPKNRDWQKRVNPWKYIEDPKKREIAIDAMCQKCHDQENDVHWVNGGFKRKWPKVEHPTPREKTTNSPQSQNKGK